ncbi:MAG: patatin-like phospholipase family protein [Rickettsiales bacterium]|nr:patatin-like phospholipase family protein [Rickettsiales bacterium]
MKKTSTTAKKKPAKTVNLALQGGGSHGAFAWGVLDYLLEDGRLDIEGISATSAGAMNAVVLAQGLLEGNKEHAREALERFWRKVSDVAAGFNPMRYMPDFSSHTGHNEPMIEQSPFYQMADFMTRVFSPYQLNPFNLNPLKTILDDAIDFEAIRKHSSIKLNICATNVETCKVRIFETKEISAEAVLASACLPFMFQSVEIDGEFFWDGGYIGNPAIFPLIYNCDSHDVVIVHINPIVRKGVPTSASEILNRLNEVSFNSSLMREMRAIAFVSKLIDDKKVKASDMKQMYIHSIRSDEEMSHHSAPSKMNTDWHFLCHLRDEGRLTAKQWLDKNYDKIGKESSVDIRKEFM